MVADEGICHRRRGLGRWERLGHPIDTLSVAACYAWLLCSRPGEPHVVTIYAILAVFSCLLVTKDEPIHSRQCDAFESWLHAVLFVLHPIVFLAFGVLWWSGGLSWIIQAQLALTIGLIAYQLIYWSLLWKPPARFPA